MVRVTVDLGALKRKHRQNDVLVQGDLKHQLLAAGIPVVGVLGIEGVERGRLVIYRDEVFGEMVYEHLPE